MGSSDTYTECSGQNLYGILDISTHRFGKLFNISRSVDTPTLKTYIFWFLVSRGIRWYIGQWPRWWSWPLINRKCPHILKTRDSPTHKSYILLFLVPCRFIWYTVNDPLGNVNNFRNRNNQAINIFVWLYGSSLPPLMASFIWETLYSPQL